MMGGRAFGLLKTGRTGPEMAKQAETPVADLPKILDIAGTGRGYWFRGIWLIGQNSRSLLSRSQF
jgi:hypothetical protein